MVYYNCPQERTERKDIKMEKKIYTEETGYGQRIVIDYGTHKTIVDVEDSNIRGLDGDRIYIAHECNDGDIVDLARIAVNTEGYIIDTFIDGNVEYTETYWYNDIDENYGSDESEVNE